MSTKSLAIVTLVLGLGTWLAWTNPTAKAYEKFQDQIIAQAIEGLEVSDGGKRHTVLQQLARSRSGIFLQSLLRAQTVRRDFFVLSLYDTELLGARIVVLGIGGTFVPLTDVETALADIEKSVLSPKR